MIRPRRRSRWSPCEADSSPNWPRPPRRRHWPRGSAWLGRRSTTIWAALEAHGLVRLAEERKWGGLTERLLVATAASYVVSPSALGPVAIDPDREVDRLSASYLIALGARIVREVADLVRRAKEARKRLATLAVDTEVRFRSPADRAAFSAELADAITRLVSKYHDESAPGGRAHRLMVVAHPYRKNPNPRSHHEREEGSLRTPFRPDRIRGPRHTGGSLARHRHRAGYFVLVRTGRVRGDRAASPSR